MYFRLPLLFLYLPTLMSSYNSPQNLSIFPRLTEAEVDREQLCSELTSISPWLSLGWPKNLRPCSFLHSPPDHNNVSLRTPLPVVGSLHRTSMGLRARFLGRRLSIHLPIIRSLHHCATCPVGHACKSATPFFTSIA